MQCSLKIFASEKGSSMLGYMLFLLLSSCASIDLKVDTVPASPEFGKIAPRVSPEKCTYYTAENAPGASHYKVLAHLVVQVDPLPIMSSNYSPNEMIDHACHVALEKGADAVIVDNIKTIQIGLTRNTSSIVKARAIRFTGDLPEILK